MSKQRKSLRAMFGKTLPLIMISLTEYAAPFIRMMALSHGLSLIELGFASILTATYGAFEQMTDFAISRFIFSAPRDQYKAALASAHALSILRGLVVGAITLALAPLVASAMNLPDSWIDFALLGPIVLIRSFEHLAPRVAERDYRYGAQFKITLIANACGLLALGVTLFVAPTHRALLVSLFTQMTMQVIGSHILADTPYRVVFGSIWLKKAFDFGYPLMLNGIGLAASSQGDRFIVASLLGLPALGVYAVAILATSVPLSMISRITSTTLMALLYNAANAGDGSHRARLRLAAKLLPLLAAINALGIMMLLNIVVPLVFGHQFHLSKIAVALLAITAFVRTARGDPFASMLINMGKTHRLAIANLSSGSALIFEFALLLPFQTFEAVMTGRLLGEIVALIVTLLITRDPFREAFADYALAMTIGATTLLCGAALTLTTGVADSLPGTLVTLVAGIGICVASGAFHAKSTMSVAFPNFGLARG